MSSKKIIFVVGPTASGKSYWALQWAKKFNGVIINCDSVQVYHGLKIGSAQPSEEEKKVVPHYLFDYVMPPEEMTAGNYSRDFFKVVEELSDDQPIFVVGGTGFYFLAIEKGMYPLQQIPDDIRQQVDQEISTPEGQSRLYQELLGRDPEAAKKIHPADKYRIGRAIEVIRAFNRTMTEIKAEFSAQQVQFPYPLLKVGIWKENEDLKSKIRARTRQMINSGLLEEVKGLLDDGLVNWAPMSSVGYKEAISYLKNEIDLDTLIEQITQNTYLLGKRQKTWFQRDREILWAKSENEFDLIENKIREFIKAND